MSVVFPFQNRFNCQALVARQLPLTNMKRRYSVYKKIVCPHCAQLVCQKTYREHRQLYFNSEINEWIKASVSSIIADSTLPDEVAELTSSNSSLDSDSPFNVSSDYSEPESSEPDSPPRDLSSPSASVDFLEEHQRFSPNIPMESENSSTARSDDSSSGSEDWDESDADEFLESSTDTQAQAPARESAFVRWITILILAFQAAYFLPNPATEWALVFFRTVLYLLSTVCPHPFLAGVLAIFPASIYLARKLVTSNQHSFQKFVVCSKCDSVYKYSDAFEKIGNRTVSRRCSYTAFPNHRQARMRRPCGVSLLKTVYLRGRKQLLVPKKVYPYKSLISSLEQMLRRENFIPLCEQWRQRHVLEGSYCDVYDGQIWKDFQNYDNQDFLSKPGNLALMLNIDWFEPFKDSPYSVGVIYLAVLNLPREERFKRSNLILVGVIPGPKEPSLHMNTFLAPLVDELLTLWDGVEMSLHDGSKRNIRAALLCVTCDIPAGKKVCGFRAFGSDYGCSRCFHKFPGPFGEKCYADFNRNEWPPRNNATHRRHVKEIKAANTLNKREELEKKYGCRYSCLLKLPYYDAVRMSTVVDPLHNMFLGTAKHIVKSAWLPSLSESDLKLLQSWVDEIIVSGDIGRIPRKIASNFKTFTGQQWKNWTNLYSLVAMNGLLSEDHLECWRHFVLASRIICSPHISKSQLIVADTLLLIFCQRAVRLYGNGFATPNMHLHGHLRQCIEDCGPVHSFWLFSFERFNGLLGRTPTNNKNVEVQLMQRFVNDSTLIDLDLPTDFEDSFLPVYPLTGNPKGDESISPPPKVSQCHWELMNDTPESRNWEVDLTYFMLPKISKRLVLNHDDQVRLTAVYKYLYPQLSTAVPPFVINVTLRRYERVSICSQTFGSVSKNSEHSLYILANWNDNGQIKASWNPKDLHPGKVLYYALHSITVGGTIKQHLFARVEWYLDHPRKEAFGKPYHIWHKNLYCVGGPASFIPVQRIANRFACTVINEDIICPYVQKLYF